MQLSTFAIDAQKVVGEYRSFFLAWELPQIQFLTDSLAEVAQPPQCITQVSSARHLLQKHSFGPWLVSNCPHIFRLRVLLKVHRAVKLHPHQAGLLYAVVCEANGLALNTAPALPEGLMVEAVEQLRCQVSAFETYAFGITLIASSVEDAHLRVRLLRQGLIELSRKTGGRNQTFGGNFTLKSITDLVSDRQLYDDNRPTPIPIEEVLAELERIKSLSRITLRFISPLRMSRSKHHREGERHSFFDRRSFDPGVFLRRVRARLNKLGFAPTLPTATNTTTTESTASESKASIADNQLVWLDVAYGGPQDRTRLGGALGDVVIENLSPSEIETLIWGQYVGVGENTRFGHGHYRVAQLGSDPYSCPRSSGLRELAFGPQFLDAAAERYDLEPGRAGQLLRQIRAGTYTPQPPVQVILRTADKERILAIPKREDRTLQRAVLDFIGPALDKLFESSSLAYRTGLGRHHAPRHLQDAFAAGYRWALKADFTAFFDSVSHEELQKRLHAYLADPQLVGLIMQWVRCGSPFPDQGLPTGAVLSPLLANIFLDEFDEVLAATNARLIRYADDFVILFKEEAAAAEVFSSAETAAEELRLSLNADKTSFIELNEPFEWLGFRFWMDDEWQKLPLGGPTPTDQLGWHDTTRSRVVPGPVSLPGETQESTLATRSLVLVGPNVQWLDVRDDRLRCGRTGSETSAIEIPWDRIKQLVCLGYPSPSSATLRQIAATGTPLVLATSSAAGDVWITSGVLEDPDLLLAQVRCRNDAQWRLELAISLVIAKLTNYAALAAACPERKTFGDVCGQLRDLAHKAGRCNSLPQLMGIEGAGAAAWYRSFGQRAAHQFSFPGRRAPGADDPLNILLNLGFTTLHRLLTLLLQQQGFAVSLGVLHEPRRGHGALASDLQEMFRHLVDRAVIEISFKLQPASFRRDEKGPYPLTISHTAHKAFRTALHTGWQRQCRSLVLETAQPYLQHFVSQVRAFRRHLLDRSIPYIPFVHPDSLPPSADTNPPNPKETG